MKSMCHLFFETLATKLKIDTILKLKEQPMCVNDLAKAIGHERSKVSHALKSLESCGFVRARKEGKNRIYSLNRETMLPLLRLIDRHVKKYCRRCKNEKID